MCVINCLGDHTKRAMTVTICARMTDYHLKLNLFRSFYFSHFPYRSALICDSF